MTVTRSCEIHPCHAYCEQFGQVTFSPQECFTQHLFLSFISGSDALMFILAEAENVSFHSVYFSSSV